MKTVHVTDAKKLAENSELETLELSVDTSGLVHLMKLLTNLYSSPRTAVLREYVSNAVDSHVKAGGVSHPIEVTVPDRFARGRNLVVRDYGVGMSKADIVNVYSSYGNSTKRDNNDEIGGFGLGAKSALAISDRFDVVSIKDGIEVKFYIEKNFQGAGVVHFVHEQKTVEPSGVEVTIPYPAGQGFDEPELNNFFVGVPSGMLKINGKLFTDTLDNEKLFNKISGIDEDIATGWFTRSETDVDSGLVDFGVIVGGVSYPVPSKSYTTKKVEQLKRFRRSVYANLPIGSVDLTPSREELIYSPRTIAVLDNTVTALHSGIETFVRSELNAINEISRAFHYAYFRRSHFWAAETLTWRGQEIPFELKFEGTVYEITAPIISSFNGKPRSPSTMGAIAGDRIELKTRIFKDDFTLVLSSAKNPSNIHELAEEARLIRRYSRSIQSATGRRGIILLSSQKDFDNKWVAIAHRKNIRTSAELITLAKTYASEQRKLAKEAGLVAKVKVTKPVAQLVTFKKGNSNYFVEKVFAGDPRLTPKNSKKVLYVKQNEHYAVFPNPYWEEGQTVNEVKRDVNGFWKMTREHFADHTIFALNSQRSMTKFKEEYPDATPVYDAVVKYATENFVPSKYVPMAHLKNLLGYQDRNWLNQLNSTYKKIKDEGLLKNVTSQDFIDLNVATRVTSDPIRNLEDIELEYWSTYKASEDAELAKIIELRKAELLSQIRKYIVVATIPNVGLFEKENYKQIVALVNSIG
jgi:hypothetical protein